MVRQLERESERARVERIFQPIKQIIFDNRLFDCLHWDCLPSLPSNKQMYLFYRIRWNWPDNNYLIERNWRALCLIWFRSTNEQFCLIDLWNWTAVIVWSRTQTNNFARLIAGSEFQLTDIVCLPLFRRWLFVRSELVELFVWPLSHNHQTNNFVCLIHNSLQCPKMRPIKILSWSKNQRDG